MAELVDYISQDGIGIITIENGKNNPLNLEILQKLEDTLQISLHKNDRAVILRSAAKHFTVGVDLKFMYDSKLGDGDPKDFELLAEAFQNVTRVMLSHPGLVIVAMKGWVIGGGFEISLAADLRIAAKNTRIMLPELKIGTMFSNAATQLLPNLIGLSRAKQLMLLGEEISGETAFSYGLINKISEESELDSFVMDLARNFVESTSEKAVTSAKILLDKHRNMGLIQVLDSELEVLHELGNDPVFLKHIREFTKK